MKASLHTFRRMK